MISTDWARGLRDYGAKMLASERADWGIVRATVIRRERIGAVQQRFCLPWHVFRLGLSGAFHPGSTTRLAGGPPRQVISGRASFYPTSTTILNDIVNASRLTYLTVEIDPTLLLRCAEHPAFPGELMPVADLRDPLTLGLLHAIRTTVGEGAGQRLFAEQAALMLLLTVRREQAGRTKLSASVSKGGLSATHLARVTDHIADQLAEDISLQDLSQLTDLSASHLCRAFKRSTGATPHRWQVKMRIERAKQLIKEPRLPLAQIALAVGFAAQPQFTTAFRRETGVTPGAWRRRNS